MSNQLFDQVEQKLNADIHFVVNSEANVDLISLKHDDSFIKSSIDNSSDNETAPLQSVSFLSSTTKNFHQIEANPIVINFASSFLSSTKATILRNQCSFSSQYSSCYEEDDEQNSETSELNMPMISSIFLNDLDERCSRICQLLSQKSGEMMPPVPALSSTPTKKPKTSTPHAKRRSGQRFNTNSECYASTRFDDSCLSSCCSLDWQLVEETQLYSETDDQSNAGDDDIPFPERSSSLNTNRVVPGQLVFLETTRKPNKSGGKPGYGSSFRSMMIKRCMKPFKRLCNMKIFEF
jgi:hypothetical protein